MLLPLILAGCAATHRGLVRVVDGRAVLIDQDGHTRPVAAVGEGSLVAGLEECEVELTARKGGGKLYVQDWKVLTGPGGGQPFVGRLRLYGSNWIVDDRSTGREIILDLRGAEELARHAGQVVLIEGYVSGAQTVSIMDWWVVSPQDD
ncbi:MAG: hypothetical protein H6742_06270 [Alphaproteobacteria bacterium]|nr:hypothetical protein [Alphaproteobacteria bacterium]